MIFVINIIDIINRVAINSIFHKSNIQLSRLSKQLKIVMILRKQNIIPITLIESNLSINFSMIQQQFKKLSKQIISLKKNSINIIDKLNVLDPDGSMEYVEKQQMEISGDNSDQTDHHRNQYGGRNWDGERDDGREGRLMGSKNDGEKEGMVIKSDRNNEQQSTQAQNQKIQYNNTNSSSKTFKKTHNFPKKIAQLPNNGYKQVLQISSNPKKMGQKQDHLLYNQSQESSEKQRLLSLQQDKSQQIVSKKMIFQSSVLKQLIKSLQLRVSTLEQNNEKQQSQLQNIEKDNEICKKFLGIKENKKKIVKQSIQQTRIDKIVNNNQIDKNQSEKEQKKSEFSQQQQTKIDSLNEINQLDKQQNQLSQFLQQNNIIVTFNSQIKQLKQYLTSKIILIQNNLKRNKQQIAEIQSQNNENRKKIQNIQQKCKQNQINIMNLNDIETKNQRLKTQQNQTKTSLFTNSNTHKKTQHSQRNLNDTVQSYINYYQDKIVQIFQQMDKLRNQYYSIVEKLTKENQIQNQQKLTSLAIKISNIKNPNQEKLRKEIFAINKQHQKLQSQFNQLMRSINQGTNQNKTFIIKPDQNKSDWKFINEKFYKFKQQIVGYIKEIQSKIINNNQITVLVNELDRGLAECKIIINKKVNTIDFEKSTKRIQTKLNNFIKLVCQREGMMQDQDASIVRQPWFCLSCDTEMKNYTGKIGRSVHHDKFTGKKVNTQLLMVRRSSPGNLPPVY